MSETKNIKMYTVSKEDIISLEISGAFYKRILGVYFNYSSKFTPEKFEELSIHSAKNTIEDLKSEQDRIDAFSLQTLIGLMTDIEFKFKSEGMIKEKDIEVPNEG